MDSRFRKFVEAPWSAPLDTARVIRSIPDSATIVGMFVEPLADTARKRGVPLPSARDKYTAYKFYPLKEHAQLLVEACVRLYPSLPVRQALRKLGRAAPQAFIESTIGKVTLGSAVGVEDALRAWVKSYSLHLRPGNAELVTSAKDHAVVRVQDIHYFLDSHHVGTFEGMFKFLDKRADIRIHVVSDTCAELLCTY